MLAHGPMASPRLRSLQHLDTRAVALPHGTEVTTRVERVVGERRVPQGSVGRVTKIEGDQVHGTIANDPADFSSGTAVRLRDRRHPDPPWRGYHGERIRQ